MDSLYIVDLDADTRVVVYPDDNYTADDVDDSIRDDVQDRIDAGEVYGVAIEKRHTWTRDDDRSQTMVTWEEVESIWGCFLDDTYTAAVVAREYFGV